ncbi:hypothetical protein HHK36_030379 [Tetracentron sinense]|uniref:Uncharacterized protein n=1 Tax=Tetracentron sinense TaxID=13715 RepID=A0A835CYM8_TETSI|nr:hypothetical protein HHK36_030379 [Tetracentron sinense]
MDGFTSLLRYSFQSFSSSSSLEDFSIKAGLLGSESSEFEGKLQTRLGSMAKEEMKEDRKNMKKTEQPSKNGVFISVYIELPTSGRRKKNDPNTTIKRKPCSSKPKVSSKDGYDRRAQLLAYARDLRHSNSQQVEWPRKNLRPKSKWSWASSPAKLRRSFQRLCSPTRRRWRYERIISEETTVIERSCCPQRNSHFYVETIKVYAKKAIMWLEVQ